jgi:hypothetical protein
MVGVTSPLFRGGNVCGGFALAWWYVIGTAISAAVILFGVTVASHGTAMVPAGVRGAALAACVGVLLMLDVFGRTPHVFLFMQGQGFQYVARGISVVLLIPVAVAAFNGVFW